MEDEAAQVERERQEVEALRAQMAAEEAALAGMAADQAVFLAELAAEEEAVAHGPPDQAPVPAPDPLDGGVGARMLLLLETPGPAVLRTGFVTRDSANGTAANLFRFLAEAGLSRADTLIWNAVPWLIHA
eukprot:COSAG06_NODE_30503_length_538_cov_0.355353_1_plen_129_part_10